MGSRKTRKDLGFAGYMLVILPLGESAMANLLDFVKCGPFNSTNPRTYDIMGR